MSLIAVMVCLSACQKRFWYRDKVKKIAHFENLPGRTVNVRIENYSPEFISKKAEEMMSQAAIKALERKGFIKSRKDTADLEFFIFLRVDSFYVYASRGGATMGNNNSHLVTKTPMNLSKNGFWEKPTVRELTMSYRLYSYKTGKVYWSLDDGLFFFNDEERDTRRSMGMIRYAVQGIQ